VVLGCGRGKLAAGHGAVYDALEALKANSSAVECLYVLYKIFDNSPQPVPFLHNLSIPFAEYAQGFL